VNWSAAEMALEPLGVVTLMSTVPEPEGDMALTEVGEMTVTSVAGPSRSRRRWSR